MTADLKHGKTNKIIWKCLHTGGQVSLRVCFQTMLN